MASGNVSSQSRSQLNCLLCLQEFKNPRILPCFHSFCEECIGDYIVSNVRTPSDKIICPVCEEKCNPPSRKVPVDKWASSFALNDMFLSIIKLEEEREDSSTLCGICKLGDKGVNAEFWCPDCRDKLCAACLRYHSRIAASKNHKTVPIAEMDTSANLILNYNQHCSCDRGHSVDVFCVEHKVMCCTLCSTTNHRNCREVRDIDRASIEFTQGNMAANVLRDVRKVMKNIQQFKAIRQTTQSTFESDIDKYIKDMDDICNDIKQQIDIFQSNFRKTATEIRENVKSKQKKNENNLHRFSTNVENSRHVFEMFNKHGDPKQKFTAYDTTISQMNSHFSRLRTELEGERDVQVRLEINKVLQDLKKMAATLGKINTESTPSASASHFVQSMDGILKTMATRTQLNPLLCAAQIPQLKQPVPRGVRHVRSVTRREVTGGGAGFSGGTSLPNGRLVMADYNNNRLVEFDAEHKMVTQYKLDGRPRDVTSRGQDVYVSVKRGFMEYYIYQCRLDGGLTVVKQIRAPVSTWGLAVSDDGTIVVGTVDSVHVLSPSGKRVHTIQTSVNYNSYVAVSQTSPPLFYHSDGNAIICRSLKDTKHLYTYRHDNMKEPRGMCVGDTGVLYVYCVGSGNVHQIERDGTGRVLLDRVHDITKPWAVLYSPHADQLVVTSLGEDTVMAVYSLK